MTVFRTVSQAVAEVGELAPHAGYVFQDMKGVETRYSYREVETLTAARANGLAKLGLKKGDRIGLVVIEPEDFVLTFLAAVRLGVVPVPLYPPLSFGALDAYAERTQRVLELSKARVLFASERLQNVLWHLVDKVTTLERLIPVESLAQSTGRPAFPTIEPSDLAFLQYTSGSTADPKGVIVTHANLIANCTAIIESGLQKRMGEGVAVSWLPLYHDMGLIGFVISTITHGMTSVFIPTMRFIKKPSVWMDAVHRHRGTVSFAPNFAYALITRKATEAELASWDLSCMEAFGCGAEPIQADTARAFIDRFSTHAKMHPEAFLPSYGMAEATLAISFKPLRELFQTRPVDAAVFQEKGLAAAPVDGQPVLEHVSCGPCFDGHEVGAFDDHGNRLPDGQEGELWLRGPSVTPGYYNNPEATAAAFSGDWLRTGDLGYLADGAVFVTGRLKDLIILNGRNVHPQAVEWVAGEVDGVRQGNVVAFARPGKESEELVVVLETRSGELDRIKAEVAKRVREEIGVAPVDIVCLEPGSLPKTSSGKLQRRKTRTQYLTGELGAEGTRTMGASGDAVTIARHVARSMWSRAKAAVFG